MLPSRPIPNCLLPTGFPGNRIFHDPPDLIGEAMGGRAWFFEIGATVIHRIGLHKGLGWKLPFGEAANGIGFVRVYVTPEGVGSLTMEFLRVGPDTNEGLMLFPIGKIEGLRYQDLKPTYNANTGSD